jgi:hypothetical protein
MTEHDFQNYARKMLSKLGYITFRVNVGKVKMFDGRYFDTGLPKGFSDIIALKDGKIYFIELKTGKNKPSQDQINFIEQMKINGFAAGIAWSLEDIFKILEEAKNE